MRLAVVVLPMLALLACRTLESRDDCMAIELKKTACYEHTAPSADDSFIRETCDSRDFRAPRADEAACRAYTDCERFTRCVEDFDREHGLSNPFGSVH